MNLAQRRGIEIPSARIERERGDGVVAIHDAPVHDQRAAGIDHVLFGRRRIGVELLHGEGVAHHDPGLGRDIGSSEERRDGKKWFMTFRDRWAPYAKKKK